MRMLFHLLMSYYRVFTSVFNISNSIQWYKKCNKLANVAFILNLYGSNKI